MGKVIGGLVGFIVICGLLLFIGYWGLMIAATVAPLFQK